MIAELPISIVNYELKILTENAIRRGWIQTHAGRANGLAVHPCQPSATSSLQLMQSFLYDRNLTNSILTGKMSHDDQVQTHAGRANGLAVHPCLTTQPPRRF
ncbi:hypothetical protein AVEN_264636-1 [Araneus ventricosus]|uniref:Uncharacterized protein n=1 Tax=Araneus ventricosus TaxID=182803 RepID=A0A4Y2T616_ARAVE|nr:hypothetical protein AVEN_264636-1 [Araneus ventricosus]